MVSKHYFILFKYKDVKCDGQIINISNPTNKAIIIQLTDMLYLTELKHPLRKPFLHFLISKRLKVVVIMVSGLKMLSIVNRTLKMFVTCSMGNPLFI